MKVLITLAFLIIYPHMMSGSIRPEPDEAGESQEAEATQLIRTSEFDESEAGDEGEPEEAELGSDVEDQKSFDDKHKSSLDKDRVEKDELNDQNLNDGESAVEKPMVTQKQPLKSAKNSVIAALGVGPKNVDHSKIVFKHRKKYGKNMEMEKMSDSDRYVKMLPKKKKGDPEKWFRDQDM